MTTLSNGLRVATKETFGELASVGICIDAGVRSETPETAGAAHILEQLAMTGTKKRPQAKFEAEIESIGASLSASTGRDSSTFQLSVFKQDVSQGIDILADLVTGPALETYDKEKSGILRKLDETEKPTRAVLDDRLHLCAFRDGPLGYSGIGPFEGIEAVTTDHLKSYVASNYTADKMCLVAAGPVKHEEVVKLATTALGGVKAGPPTPFSEKPYFCGAELIYRNDEMGPLAYISVGWEGVPWKSPDAVTFMIMENIIGSYKKDVGVVPGVISGNRTTNAVANKMGVGCAEEFEAFNKFYKDTGMFGWYAVCDEVAVEHCVGEMMFGVNLLSFSVTDEEVERAKRELKIKLFSGSGSAEEACTEVGQQVMAYGRGIPSAEMILRIDAIDAEEVKRVAYTYLNDQEVAVTALGPLHGFPQYLDLRRQTIMHRY